MRLGDIVRGFLSSTVQIKKPILKAPDLEDGFNLDVTVPKFSVVLTPCCSIDDNKLTLCPLLRIPSNMRLDINPYFKEAPTRINDKNMLSDSIPPDKWRALKDVEKEEKILEGKVYSLVHYFIFDGHEYFPSYQLRGSTINHYMIDFRTSYSIKSPLIKRSNGKPLDEALINSKVIQLSGESRSSLRNKISAYYGRVPEEDLVLLF